MKRLGDLALCAILVPVLLPIMLATAVLIKLDSPGPICFRQLRIGFRGRTFMLCKFRTMTEVHNGDHRDKSVTQPDDDRITRIGRFLRKTRIDELPQIWNILRGDMSWIGPRPEAISLSNWYENEIPFYRYRHIVRPGISGWAQVNQGHVTKLKEINQKLQYDFYYIKNITYWLDILIFFKTLRVVLNGFGSK
jgi:lipopolysaccharide/colanic/teichoic acid biosynthesis glycosyltransferase